MTNESKKPKTARSYRATVVGDNTVVSINLKWAGQVLILVAGLVYSYLQVENRIRELERRVELSDTSISDLINRHIVEEEAKIAQMQQELDWYEKELNLNPLSWGKKKRKK
jgi:uncharacterized coiled-coil protein SlyX|tara:strand:- start:225 stop:557 length:333 start_codon:yes stop_codon:yes gene_type:complete